MKKYEAPELHILAWKATDVVATSCCNDESDYIPDYKPVIYLYPEDTTNVTVVLNYDGDLTVTYPTYIDAWNVTATPDGTLTDLSGRKYYCLFWEGMRQNTYDFSKGFVVPGHKTAEFLEQSLEKLGLSEREANEFIIYWLPKMCSNAYNLISFQAEAYTDHARLEITPAPDTVIRVFMAWKGMEAPVDIEPQELSAPKRNGFTVIEWGGSQIG